MKCRGVLLYNRVIIPDYSCANKIYWEGYYGSFLGVQKPRDKDIKAPLELSLIEALYLLETGIIEVLGGEKNVTSEELLKKGEELVEGFRHLYKVYRDLRRREFIVRRGLKFGCDYLVYRYGPGIDHAPYGVQVYSKNTMIDPIDIVRMGRLLHSVRKKLIIAVVDGESIKYILFNWWKP